jgi:large subunit ribosomal protein L3
MPPRASLNWGLLPPSFLLPSSTRCLLPLVPLPKPSQTTVRTIKSTNTPKPDRFAHHPAHPALKSTSTAALARKAHSTPLRTGLLAQKRGMTAMFNPETGKRQACTVLQFDRNVIISHKTRKRHGYWAVQVGAGDKQIRNLSKPMVGHFAAAGVAPKRWVMEFKVKDEKGLGVAVGESIGPSWFNVGQWVDVKAISRGMGFAGVSRDC